MDIRLEKFGTVLLTRDQGKPIRAKLLSLIRSGHAIRVLFDDVETVTPSFADEVIGRMLLDLGEADFRKNITLVCSDPATRRLVNAVLANRKRELLRS
ncbi:MAG TPA: STAS-like domain-containing protein [Planctomycetota bacterium]|nr:STAS-like domain-containing protein [Planctomycetota bacterium]